MNVKHAIILAVAAAAAAFEVSATELVPLDWSADGRFAKGFAVPAGKFVEACGKLPAQATVQWRFDGSVPLDFNIHFHEGKEVRFPAQQNQVAQASGTLDAKVDQDYCWMWTNKSSAEATLKVELTRH